MGKKKFYKLFVVTVYLARQDYVEKKERFHYACALFSLH